MLKSLENIEEYQSLTTGYHTSHHPESEQQVRAQPLNEICKGS